MKQKEFTLTGGCLKIVAGMVLIGIMIWGTYQLASFILPFAWKSDMVMFGLCFAMLIFGIEFATVVLSPGSSTPFGILGAKPSNSTPDALRSRGLLVSETFHARRAFEVEPKGDEGSQYFIELADGRVLFMAGQHLDDYGPITDDPELNQPRSFPCTKFTVHSDARHGGCVQIDCSGDVIEPSPITPPFTKAEYRLKQVPSDGEILDSESYDTILARRLAPV